MWRWNHLFLSCRQLSKSTTVFGLKLWVVVCIGVSVGLIFLFLSFFLAYLRRHRASYCNKFQTLESAYLRRHRASYCNKFQTLESATKGPKQIPEIISNQDNSASNDIYIEIQKSEDRPGPTVSVSRDSLGSERRGGGLPEVSHLGWGHWYTMRELEEATGGLAAENIVGEGGYGIVYHGVLGDHTDVAIKSLLNNRGQAEKEFRVEVDAIGRVRHKNLVRLLGYCAEGVYRMLVYEYVDNGNLDKWLHGEFGEIKPLTWDTRMKIVLGTAKGLAYLHDGLEPKVVHRDIKASNILLDRHWHPKVSDFGLAKLLCSEKSYVTTRVMGTFGYVAPEYANTGMLNEKSDVYSFGVLIMEIISGRVPVDYTRPRGEVHLVEWLKTMVGERKFDLVVDPKISEKPSSKALKRTLLVALRCTDPDAHNRPKMGQVIHMLETDAFLVCHNHKQEQ